MRICLIGDDTPPLDEGMKNTTYALVKFLDRHADVIRLSPLRAHTRSFWEEMRQFGPDVVHYIPGPSIWSFVLLSLSKRFTNAASVMSLTHPSKFLPRSLVRHFLRPDLVIAQSQVTGQAFMEAGCRVSFLPNGVDTELFRPVTDQEKRNLRTKYALPKESFIVLHVGNARRSRHLKVLTDLQSESCQVLVVCSSTIGGDRDVISLLGEVGCILIDNYVDSIQEIYALSDCYVFPTASGTGAIEFPLSVLEAMASNLPIVARRFGGLPISLREGKGFYFVDSDQELRETVKNILRDTQLVDTRSMALTHDWRVIVSKLVKLYQGLITLG